MKFRNIVFFLLLLGILLFIMGCDEVPTTPDVDAPVNLSITVITEGRINLTWDYLKQTTGVKYVVGRKVGEGEWNDTYADVTTKSFVDDIPTSSYNVYSYKVKAVSADGEKSSFFSEPAAYFSPLTKPSNLSIRQIDQKELELTWLDNVKGEGGYRIDRKVGDGGWTNGYKTLPENTTSYIDSFSNLFVDISYRVYAYVGTSYGPKETVSITPAYPQPTNVYATQLSFSEIKFGWDYSEADTEIIDGFEVHRRIGSSDWELLRVTAKTVKEIVDVPNKEVGTFAYRVRSYKGETFSAFSDHTEVNFNLKILGSTGISDKGNKLIIKDSRVYVANNYDGISILNISNPNSPTAAGRIDLPDKTISLALKDNLLFTGSYNGYISIIDLSGTTPNVISGIDTKNPVYDLAVYTTNNETYLVSASGNAGIMITSFDSGMPKIVSRYNTMGTAQGIAIENTTLYLGDGHNGLIKLDISDPNQPQKIDENKTLGNCLGVKILNNNLYISTGTTGMKIVDKTTLHLKNYYDTPGYLVDVEPTNRYAYLADREKGFQLLHTVNEMDLISLSLIPFESTLTAVRVKGNYAYLLSEKSLQIIQVLP